jgi:hypothetical protein
MKPQPSPVEVLNNINGDLVTLYRVVQNHLEEFVRQFKWGAQFAAGVRMAENDPPRNPHRHPARRRFFYLQHHAFAGKVSGQTFGTATTAPAINLLRIKETSRPRGSACSAPTSKTSPGLNALNATTVPIPSITWIRLTDRPPVMESTSLTRITNGWPTSCVAAKAK